MEKKKYIQPKTEIIETIFESSIMSTSGSDTNLGIYDEEADDSPVYAPKPSSSIWESE